MTRIVKKEDAVVLFTPIMKRRRLRSEDIKTGSEKIDIYGNGEYHCEACTRKWHSECSWITLDLKEKVISKRWLMKCKKCRKAYEPYFEEDHIVIMIDLAVSIYKGEFQNTSIDIGRKGLVNRSRPHIPELCEKCKWGEERCWMYKYRYPRNRNM